MRNVESTKQRLLAAATAEFAERGMAGARIDRIAEQAGANKALIYAYFGNKEQLFGCALGAVIECVARDAPFDAADLPGYVARRFDWRRANLEASRFLDWARLEGVDLSRVPKLADGYASKVAAIAQAQREGIVSDRFRPRDLLAVIDALVMTAVPPDADAAAVAERRRLIVDAIRRLVEP
ncbi:MAG: TetR family transcriptional regulator [Thermomicrobiales bacterium]|nr:TetR family transcriptional regulator [Thermomicrobiales bacterium]